MFAKSVIDSDLFLEMPATTQMLYFHLAMRADDDGFVGNPKRIMRMVGASDDDMKILLAKQFIFVFESGVIVIRHWKLHNLIKSDRYKETLYSDEFNRLTVDQNKVYGLSGTQMEPVWNPNGTQMEPQDRLGKDSIGKDRLVQDRLGEDKEKTDTNVSAKKKFAPPTVEEVEAYCQEMGYGIDPDAFVDYYEARGWMAGKTHMKDWKAACRTWERRRREEAKTKKSSGDDFMERLMNA